MLLWEVFLITNGLALRETKLCYGLFVTVFICILFFSRNPEQWRITFSAKKSSKPLPSCSYHSQMRSRNYIIIRQRITYPRYLRSNRPLATRYAITEINKNKKEGEKWERYALSIVSTCDLEAGHGVAWNERRVTRAASVFVGIRWRSYEGMRIHTEQVS